MRPLFHSLIRRLPLPIAIGCALTATAFCLAAADHPGASAAKQADLIRVLQSNAAPGDKAIACKQLAIYGSQDAVPVLAPLLADAELASWARIALEAIPGPAADAALRQALYNLQGRLLIGAINSLGARRDPYAIPTLTPWLKDADPDVAAATAVALGKIGGDDAAKILGQALKLAPNPMRPAVAEGCIRCAEQYLDAGNHAAAVKLYDAVRRELVPKQIRLEATRGAILARQLDGLPLLTELWRSDDRDYFSLGLRVARELPGHPVTEALAAEVERTTEDRQAWLLMALADRPDPVGLPTLRRVAKHSPKTVRLVALDALKRLDTVPAIPVLLATATEDDAALVQAAKVALASLPGPAVDADLLARLPQASGKPLAVLLELAGARNLSSALPTVVRFAGHEDAAIRAAAVGTLGSIGQAQQVGDLVKLLRNTAGDKERADLEKALVSLSVRCRAEALPFLLPLTESQDGALRVIALHCLARVGGPNALARVKSALEDAEDRVQDEAVRTLSTWANNWPDDTGVAAPLLQLARSGKKTAHQVLGLRGYLDYVEGTKALTDDHKVAQIKEVIPLANRTEEKRLAISLISSLPTAASLDLLLACAGDTAIAEEAYLALVNLAAKKELQNAAKQPCVQALRTVVEKTKVDRTKQRANEALKRLTQ